MGDVFLCRKPLDACKFLILSFLSLLVGLPLGIQYRPPIRHGNDVEIELLAASCQHFGSFRADFIQVDVWNTIHVNLRCSV